ncbi:hypothetical protein QWZ08_09810 [Ferruginibacter paludis]|uniref:hypothetical protein n=1 Tax=Ferruginibacter paludis TaxID=1310417 RepID=UPI0025B545BF|nr:hypothetical protein [Ferruginibacter paludis]MDN3655920.1 hypothetical protein [Ferruginibacter paludis]
MERIVIEVADETAKKWQNVSPKIKSHLEKSFEKQIDEIVQQLKVIEFDNLLQSAGEEAARNGLTEETLQQLLNEE